MISTLIIICKNHYYSWRHVSSPKDSRRVVVRIARLEVSRRAVGTAINNIAMHRHRLLGEFPAEASDAESRRKRGQCCKGEKGTSHENACTALDPIAKRSARQSCEASLQRATRRSLQINASTTSHLQVWRARFIVSSCEIYNRTTKLSTLKRKSKTLSAFVLGFGCWPTASPSCKKRHEFRS